MTPAARKTASERRLRALGAAINPHLPWVESEVRLRTAEQVARRILVLLGAAGVAHGLDRDEVVAWLRTERLWNSTCATERRFLAGKGTQQDRVDATWGVEGAWLLAWALRLRTRLGLPVKQCATRRILEVVPGLGEATSPFTRGARLRSPDEILEASDLIYRAHWACRNRAHVSPESKTGRLECGVVQEWHRAVNWLTCYGDARAWDRVATDT